MPRLSTSDSNSSMSHRRVWLAYLCGPVGAALFVLICDGVVFLLNASGATVSVTASRAGDLGRIIAVAVAISYIAGAFLLPFYWIFDERGWRGWRYYVPTSTVWGVVVAWVMSVGRPTAPWSWYAMCAGSGAACGAVFSMCLAARRRSSPGR
jgi:hypothetical protein